MNCRLLRLAACGTAALCTVALAACGGGVVEAPPVVQVEHSETHERVPDARQADPEGVSITGLIGHISPEEVRVGMDAKQDRFLQCFARRLDAIDVMAGEITLMFHIDVTGHVMWVFPQRSDLGDRETEQCILGVAASARFPRPHGGEAEFSYPLAFDLPDDTRPALNWTPQRLARVLEEQVGLSARCRPDNSASIYTATVYVARGGTILSVGVSTSTYEGVEGLECVASAIREWQMPNPGSYPAKVTFEVP